jgi:LmbE family N-acetylglucosaminyl deacetylase
MNKKMADHFIGKDDKEYRPLKILVFQAHPDDPDATCGGIAALYSNEGHRVRFVTVTNGDAGHPEMGGVALARRRRAEAAASGEVLGIEYITLDNHDSVLTPSLEIRHDIVRMIREYEPDLIITHRPYDYHPDHRAVSILVQDAIGVLCVPNIVSDVPNKRYTPSVVYAWDDFKKPYPFIPDIVVGIDAVIDTKVDALHCHKSQYYELFPYNKAFMGTVPENDQARRKWLFDWYTPKDKQVAERYRDKLVELYGEENGMRICYAEAFEFCEYGAPIPDERIKVLFPFY